MFKLVKPVQQQREAIIGVHINAEPQRPDAVVIEDLSEDLPVELLYREKTIKNAVISFTFSRKIFFSRNALV